MDSDITSPPHLIPHQPVTYSPNANPPQDTPDSFKPEINQQEIDTEELIFQLRRKQGNWVSWGEACQALQKARMSQQAIFEATGFEPIHQNQVIVASQVFRSLEAEHSPAPVIEHFQQRGSDVLYELRILAQSDRATAAALAHEHRLDLEEAREVAKAVKDFGRLKEPPAGYDSSPGDAVAYQAWRVARQEEDLQSRSRSIARGLKFANSDASRQALEKLLTDFTVVKTRPAPKLPVFRLEAEDEQPAIIPVAGQWPLSKSDLQAVPVIEAEGRFGIVKHTGAAAWVALPGWQVLLNAGDPIAVMADGEDVSEFPTHSGTAMTGELLLAIDRDDRTWRDDCYYVVEEGDRLTLSWFDTEPDTPIIGRLLIVLRPKVILDEDFAKDPWQVDE